MYRKVTVVTMIADTERQSERVAEAGELDVLTEEPGHRGGHGDDRGPPVSFFITVLSRASCSDRFVSNSVVTMSRNDSVHSVARRTWS